MTDGSTGFRSKQKTKPSARRVVFALATALNLSESKPQRDLLRPLLMCDDTTPEIVAELCQKDIEVVRRFECNELSLGNPLFQSLHLSIDADLDFSGALRNIDYKALSARPTDR